MNAKPISRNFLTLDDIDVSGKRVVVRMDLNVPMVGGRVTDNTRVVRLLPTLKELLKKKAKIIILSHLGRPKGAYVPDLSLAPIVDALSQALGMPVKFGVDCVGTEAEKAVAELKAGEVILLENIRFHEGEEKNRPEFAKQLAAHGDIYVNDAFSCSHRAHASTVGITQYLPFVAGRLMEEELHNIETYLTNPERPFTAVVGGSKVSTKLALLESLVAKVDNLIIGGAMANTFLLAEGYKVGASLCEPDLKDTAKRILAKAKEKGCTIHLPVDVKAAINFEAHAVSSVVPIANVPEYSMMLDVGLESVIKFSKVIKDSKTLIWNGPLGAFETSPFDAATIMLVDYVARRTAEGELRSIAGGGDTVSALRHAGVAEQFSYLSTAGGAFLEWLEGKTLPGVLALQTKKAA